VTKAGGAGDRIRDNPVTLKDDITRGISHLPGGVWALGFTSLLMDTSSELVHSLLPVFLATVLGASVTTIGILEGAAEATAAITKVFSGTLSDYLGKRKLLVVLGHGLGAVTKPIFPLAPSVSWVFGARLVDRIGKGIRGAPRDALVADLTAPDVRGAAYGLRQALDTVGAVIGPLLAVGLHHSGRGYDGRPSRIGTPRDCSSLLGTRSSSDRRGHGDRRRLRAPSQDQLRPRDSAERIFDLIDNLLHLLLDLSDRLVGLPLPLQPLIAGQGPRSFLHAPLQLVRLATRHGCSLLPYHLRSNP
jgi:hypothetical protein